MIRTVHLTIGYRQGKKAAAVLQDLHLRAEQGELVALIGPNGCGKSTLLRTLAGLQQPLDGSILIQTDVSSPEQVSEKKDFLPEQELKDLSLNARAQKISLVLTDTVHLGYITVKQLVSMGRHPYTTFSGKLTDSDAGLIDASLAAVHLMPFANRLVSELSDGERQRVMIAKALAQDTPIILLDEPTSFLDLPNRVEIMLLLKKLATDLHKTILMSTHEIDLAIRLAHRIWLMKPRESVLTGTPRELTMDGSIQSVFHGESFGFDPDTGRVIIF
jgi:iron complex transport system ATP-binding protein